MYNIFKRPMFKRGGSTTGTGIMSHVESRVNAANGFYPAFGQQIGDMSSLNIPRTQFSASSVMGIPQSNYTYSMGAQPQTIQDFYKKQAENRLNLGKFFENVQPADEYYGYKIPKKEKAGIETVMESSRAMGADAEIDKQVAQTITTEQVPLEKTPEKETTKYEETSGIKEEVKAEAKMLRELLRDEDYSKGELALLVAGALREPGGIGAKLDKARELALPLARKRKEEDRAITLAAYKLAKEKEQQQIKAGTLGEKQKLIEQSIDAQYKAAKTVNPNITRQDISDQVYKNFATSPDSDERRYFLRQAGAEVKRSVDDIILAKRELDKVTDTGSKKYQKKKQSLDELVSDFKRNYASIPEFASQFPQYAKDVELKSLLGYKAGGRVMKAIGGEAESDIVSSEVSFGADSPKDATVVEKPVEKLSFNELRDRLPKEVTDDVVNLLSSSEEALQDFAYIRTQEDVNSFNVKYGVNLVIPPATA
jgi:hypothetical protein